MNEHNDATHDNHITSYKTYVIVWLILLVFTGITVAVAISDSFDMGNLNVWIALFIATIKATLVLLIFMHVKHDKPIIWYTIIAAVGTMIIFMILTFSDYWFRPELY